MPKLDLVNAAQIKGAPGEWLQAKSQGWSWVKPGANEQPIHSMMIGAVDSGSLIATVLTEGTTDSVRLMASTSPAFTSPIYSAPATPHAAGFFARCSITGLAPDTLYYLAAEVGGVRSTNLTGQARTWATGLHSFSYAAASCAQSNSYLSTPGTASNGFIWDRILDRATAGTISEFMHMGDMHYGDIDVDDPNEFYKMFRRVLSQSRQAAVWSALPLDYQRDDHDGPTNNGNVTSPAAGASNEAYRTFVPHRPLGSATLRDPVYFSRVRGRVRRIVTDVKTFRSPQGATDNESKVVLGATQEAWFKAECLAAKSAGQLIEWVNTKPWVSSADTDTWFGYSTERTRIATWLVDNDISRRMWILSGDMHASAYVAADDNPWGGFPVFHAAPLERGASNKGGPYTIGPFPDVATFGTGAVSQVGLLDYTDNGVDGGTIRFRAFRTDRDTGVEGAALLDVSVTRPGAEAEEPAIPFGTQIQSAYYQRDGSTGTGTIHSVTLANATTVGSLLVAEFGVDKLSGGITLPAGFVATSTAAQTAGVSGVLAYKIADGTEGALAFGTANSRLVTLRVVEVAGPFAELPLDVTAADTAGTSKNSTVLTAGNASQDQLYAHAIYLNDSRSSISGAGSASNGFTAYTNGAANGSAYPGLISAHKVFGAVDNPTTTGVSTTLSHAGINDETIGFLAGFAARAKAGMV